MNIEEKAAAAERLRRDEAFALFMAEAREDAISAFVASGREDIQAREEAHALLCALAAIEGRLDAAIGAKAFKAKKEQHRNGD